MEASKDKLKPAASWQEQRVAAMMLVYATGCTQTETSDDLLDLPVLNSTSLELRAVGGVAVDGYPSLRLSSDAHPGALRELAKACQDGQGVSQNARLALELFRESAALGDPEAQGEMGVRYAMGLQRPSAWDSKGMVGFGEPDDSEALMHYYYGAMGGDPLSLMAMAHRHQHGLGVPRSCWSAATYYQPIAEQVCEDVHVCEISCDGYASSPLPACAPGVALLRALCEKGRAAGVLQRGHEQYFRSEYQPALLSYLKAGQMGVELGMSNAAWMLDRGYLRQGPHLDTTAFGLYRLSAELGNSHSLLMTGDKAFYGKGTGQDWVRAAAIYYEAYAERLPEAMFNLGFVHEFGAGAPQDLTLARRFYDMAKHTLPDAALPVALAHTWLSIHAAWLWLKPALPSRFDWVWSRILVLEPPHTGFFTGPWISSLGPSQLMLHAELLWVRNVGLAGWVRQGVSRMGSEYVESAVLLALLAALVAVLRTRRLRAGARVARTAAAGGQGAVGQGAGQDSDVRPVVQPPPVGVGVGVVGGPGEGVVLQQPPVPPPPPQ
ncbi:MAG: hypothetical protein WDW36_004655 [Sanguina aurantia]